MKEFFLLETGRHIRYEEQDNRRKALMSTEKPELVLSKPTGQCFSSSKNGQGNGSHSVAETPGPSDWYQGSYSLNRVSNYQSPFNANMNLQQPFENEQPHRHTVAEDFNVRKGSLSSSDSTSGRFSGEECGSSVQAYPTFSNSGPFESAYGNGNGWHQQQQLPSGPFHSASVQNCFDSSSSTDSSPGSHHERTPNEVSAKQSFSQVQHQHEAFQESTSIYTEVMYQYQSDVMAEPQINGGQFGDTNNNSNVAFSNGNVYTCLQ